MFPYQMSSRIDKYRPEKSESWSMSEMFKKMTYILEYLKKILLCAARHYCLHFLKELRCFVAPLAG